MRTHKDRDYKKEYALRLARAEALGLSRGQARGHAKAHEQPLRPNRSKSSDAELQLALKAIRQHGSLGGAAKWLKIAPERLRRLTVEKNLIEKHKGKWRLRPNLERRFAIFSRGRRVKIKIDNPEDASTAGRYMTGVREFLHTNKLSFLEPFEGRSVVDTSGKRHPLETDANTLYRLNSAGEASFEQIYRIII